MSYLVFISSLLQPIYTFPLSFIRTINKNTGNITSLCLALALATIAFTMEPAPNYDLYRHYERMADISYIPLYEVWNFSKPGYRIFDYYSWLINYLKLPKETLAASVVLIAYSLVLSVFNDLKIRLLHNNSSAFIFIALVILFFRQDLVGLASGIRNPLANILVFYLCYSLLIKQKVFKFLIGSIIAFFIHPFALVPALLTYIAYLFSWWSKSSKFLIVIAAILTISSSIINIIIEYILYILSDLGFFKAVYLSEEGRISEDFVDSRSLMGLLMGFILPRAPIYLAQIYLLFIKPKSNDMLYLLLSIMTLYLGIFHSFPALFGRMAIYYAFIFSTFLIIRTSQSRSKYDIPFLVLYSSLIIAYFFGSIYAHNNLILSNTSWLFKPLLFILYDI